MSTLPVAAADGPPTSRLPRSVYGFVWRVSGRHQIALSILSVVVFLMTMAPLELQRRIVNDVIRRADVRVLVLMCVAYAAIALFMGAVKLGLNVYRGWVSERATLRLRRDIYELAADMAAGAPDIEGIEVAMVVSEVEPVGGFVGSSISEPLLQGGLLVTVLAYMLYLQPWMALVSFAVISPQLVFVPLMQAAINRRAAVRVRVMRDISSGLVHRAERDADPERDRSFARRVGRVFDLDMSIFRRKYTMNFLMNALHHVGVVGVLLVGGWFAMTGRTDLGTVVAFISGLRQLKDPWGDIVKYFRASTAAQVKYRLIAGMLEQEPGMP